MNNIIISGRLTRDPDIRASVDGNTLIARYSIAVDRHSKDNGADFINCTAFNKAAEFVEKYLKKGMKIIVQGSLHTDSYTNKEGAKVYTSEVYVQSHEFCESRKDNASEGTETDSDAQSSNKGKYAGR